jgi:ElaB/YqjD/DUF883 family membrane-anchored ribosome-binding protein
MPDTSDLRRTGETVKARVSEAVGTASETVKSRVNDAVDQASRVAADATDTVRQQGARLAENAQEFYDDIEGDTAGDKLRTLITDYPVAALLVAGAAGYLIGRALHDRR